jgi:hypothetical protein
MIRLGLTLLGKGLNWLGTWLEAQYDKYHLNTADRPC